MKRKSITAMVLFALTALLCATAFAEKLDYTLSKDGTLIISGNGAITQSFMARSYRRMEKLCSVSWWKKASHPSKALDWKAL